MTELELLFAQYKKNMDEMDALRNKSFEFPEEENWKDWYRQIQRSMENIYQKSAVLLKKLTSLINGPMTIDLADSLYEQTMKMYRENYDDGEFLIIIFNVLEPFYESLKDKDYREILIPMYLAHSYELNAVMYSQASIEQMNVTMLEKVLAFEPVFDTLSEQMRICFWKAVFNYVIVGTDHKNWTVAQSFALFEYYWKLWESDHVQEIEKNNSAAQAVMNNFFGSFACITYRINELEEKNVPDFIRIMDLIYERQIVNVSDEKELGEVTYAGYLYSSYLKGEETINTIFDQFCTYYQCVSRKISEEEIMDKNRIYFFYGCTTILYCFAQKGINPEKKNQMIGMIRALTESKWRIEDTKVLLILMDLTTLLCDIMVDFSGKEIDIEDFYYQMLVCKNIPSFIHARHVAQLAVLLLEEALLKKPVLFDQYSDMPLKDFVTYVEKCGLFHDIGSIATSFLTYYRNRPLLPAELELINMHPLSSLAMVEKSHEMDCYKNVMAGHHKSFDGKSGFPEEIDNTKFEDKILIDLIHIVDYIDIRCDAFFSYQATTVQDLLHELDEKKGTEFHPDFVEMILENRVLQEKIQEIVQLSYTSLKEYHENAEGIAVYQSTEEFVSQLDERMQEAFSNHTPDDFMKYVDRLFAISAREYSDRLLGVAYYYTMRVHMHKDEYTEAMNAGREAVRYLDNTEEYEKTTTAYNILGAIMQIMGNKENGLHYFLMSLERAKLCEDADTALFYPYNNIANLMKNVGQVDRALYYYNLAEKLNICNDMLRLAMYCNIMYCYVLTNNDDKIAEYYELIKTYEQEEDYPVFLVNVYTACLHEYYDDIVQMVESIKFAIKDRVYLKEYSSYMDEIHICLDLLEKHEEYELLMEMMNQCLDYFKQDMISFQEYQRFLQQKARCEKKCGDRENLLKTLSILEENIEHENSSTSEKILDLEKNYADMLKRQANQRYLQREKERLEKEVLVAREANQAKNTFLSAMSHEIRTPIHAILGLDEMILRESKNEMILDYANDIENAGRTLLGIINDVLDFSKMESGQLEIDPVEYDTKSLILDLKNMIAPRAKEKNLAFEILCDESLPCTLYGDELRIKQVILNILTNAVKYTSEGKVSLGVTFDEFVENMIKLVITVTDTGMGMKEEDLEKLFKPFERIEENKNKNIEGTGLGMSIVFSLIKQMDGTIDVKSEYTKGSQFIVSIPQNVVDKTHVGDIFQQRTGNYKRAKQLFTAPGAKILVVDDNAVNIKVVTSLLKRNQVQISTAVSGFECLDMTRQDKYDLILLDHRMPELDGVETLKRLKEECALNKETPIIALTANAISGAYDFYISAGFDDLLTKPVNVMELETKIMRHLPQSLILHVD